MLAHTLIFGSEPAYGTYVIGIMDGTTQTVLRWVMR